MFSRLVNVADGKDNHDVSTVGQIAKTNQTVKLASGSNVLKTNGGANVATFTKMAKVDASDAGFVAGSDLYNETRKEITSTNTIAVGNTAGKNLSLIDQRLGADADGTYYDKGDTVETKLAGLDQAVAANLAATDKLIKYDADASEIMIGSGDGINADTVSFLAKDGTTTRKLSGVTAGGETGDAATWEQIAAKDQEITLADGDNVVMANDGTTKLATFTGMKKVASDDYGFVSGADLFAETREKVSGTYVDAANDVGTNLSVLDDQVTTNTDDIAGLKDMDNLTVKGQNKIKELSQAAVQVAAGTNVTVDEGTDADGNKIYTVNADLENADIIKQKANIDASNVGKNLKADDGVSAASTADITKNLNAWGEALGRGKVDAYSDQLVTGATIYAETRENVSGTYVDPTDDVGTNLSALDTQLTTNTNDIAGLKELSNITPAGQEVIKDLSRSSVKVLQGDNVTVQEGEDTDGNKTYTVSANLGNASEVKQKAEIDASNIGNNLKDDDGNAETAANIQDNLDSWGEALGSGTIAEDSNQLVTGATVYAETRENVKGEYVDPTKDVGTNLSTLDTQLVTNTNDIKDLRNMSNLTEAGQSKIKELSKSAVKLAEGDNVKIAESDNADGSKTYTVSADFANAPEMKKKAEIDASNIGSNLKGSDGTSAATKDEIEKNLTSWGQALGTGEVKSDSEQLVTGGTVYNETRANVSGTYVSGDKDVGQNLSTLDTHVVQNEKDIAQNAKDIAQNKTDISNLQTQVKTNTDSISKLDTQVKTNTDTISNLQTQMGDQQKLISYDEDAGSIMIGNDDDIVADKVSIAGTKGNRTLTGLKEGKGDSDAATVGQMNKAIDDAISGSTYEIESGTPDTLTVTKDEANKKWTVSAKTGDVSADNKGLVTGDKVAAALETAKTDGGSYEISANNRTATVLNKDGSTAFSLTVEASAGGAYTSGDHITIDDDFTIDVKTDGKVASGDTGIVTGGAVYEKVGDTSKLSAAGLGDNLSDSVIGVNDRVTAIGDRITDMSNDINKVGAGAAALAALHPEAYNPNDKLSFAIGLGHYKNANAGAIGAFYKPNPDSTVSIGTTIGNGSSMFNIGYSFKFGKRSDGASIYSSSVELAREVNTLRRVNADQAKEIGDLKADNAQMKAQIAEILKKLELSGTVNKTMAAH